MIAYLQKGAAMRSVNEEPIRLTRREALRCGALGAAALGAGGLVAACGSSSATPSIKTTPRRGGKLEAGLSGGTSTDTLDPLTWENLVDGARCFALYDSLVAFDKNALPQLSLAQEFEPNANATEWTVRLRPGITFHDGRPLTADDVIYTYQQIVNPKLPLIGAASLVSGGVDVAGMRKLDKLTVRIPCHRPFASLDELNACYNFFIIPVGFDPKRPIGTGAFKYVSFTPGQQSVFVRNDSYWGSGPYLEELVITDFADESSQINGLLSGQVDVVDALSATSIAAVQSGGANVLVALGGGHTPLTMRVDQAPFNDVRVRQAFRLIPDRQQMINLIFGGHGTLGNDLFANYDPSYDHALAQRHQDLAEAKYLLKQAGHEKLTVEMITSDIAGGTVKLAEVFAEQARGAGVTVNLNQINSTEFFGPNYCKWTFAQDWWQYYPYLPRVQWSMLPVSPFNECHVDDPVYNKLYDQAVSTVDLATRTQIIHEMQTREWEGLSSGYIIPYFTPMIDAYSKHVHGVTGSRVGLPLGCYDFKNFWMD
jgi:peptide/nickel transport system substrate-binding protein